MASPNTAASLNALYFQVYGDSITRFLPETNTLQKFAPFQTSKTNGRKIALAAEQSMEHGATYHLGTEDAVTMNDEIAGEVVEQEFDGSVIALKLKLGYLAASKGVKSKQSYENVVGNRLKALIKGTRYRLEASLWYGQGGLFTAATSTNVGVTETTINIDAAELAPWLVAGLKKAELVFADSASGAVVASLHAFVVKSIDFANGRINVTGAQADITALDTACTNGTVRAFFKGSVADNSGTVATKEMLGLVPMFSASSVNGLTVATNEVVQGNTYAVGGALTVAKIEEAAALAGGRGAAGKRYTCFCSPKAFAGMTNASGSVVLNRYWTEQEKDAKVGAASFTITSPVGDIKVIACGWVKNGNAVILSDEDVWGRYGSADVSMTAPGAPSEGEVFFHDPSATCYIAKSFSHQAIAAKTLAHEVLLTGIA